MRSDKQPLFDRRRGLPGPGRAALAHHNPRRPGERLQAPGLSTREAQEAAAAGRQRAEDNPAPTLALWVSPSHS